MPLIAAAETVTVVSCGPAGDDRAIASAIVEASGGAARIAPETPSLADLAALFSCSRLYVGGDTGPMHVASLVGTPVVQILGPTEIIVWISLDITTAQFDAIDLPKPSAARL